MGKINWYLSSQNFHNEGKEITTSDADNPNVVNGIGGHELPQAILLCKDDVVRMNG